MDFEQAISFAHQVSLLARHYLGDSVNGHLPEHIARTILADGLAALETLEDVQRRVNIHKRSHAQAVIMNLAALLACIEEAGVIVGAGLQGIQDLKWVERKSAFQSRIRTGTIVNTRVLDVNTFLEEALHVFVREMQTTLHQHNAVKVNAVLVCEFATPHGKEPDTKTFNTKNVPIWRSTELSKWFEENIQDPILRDLEDFQEKDSGWSLQTVLHLVVNINKYNPIRGRGFIELPPPIAHRQACINIKTKGDDCFKWAVLSALHPATKHADRLSKYKLYEDRVKTDGLVFPLMPEDVPKFERLNPDISVNVYILEKRKNVFSVLPYYVSRPKKVNHVNLLLAQNYYVDEDEETLNANPNPPQDPIRCHYVWIKNMSALIGSQVAKWRHKKFICDRCLHYFWSADKLAAHEVDCDEVNECKPKMPEQWNKYIQFKNYKYQESVPFIIYADLECLLKKVEESQGERTKVIQEHEPFSLAYYFHCSYDNNLSGFHSYRGSDPSRWFAQRLMVTAAWVKETYENPAPMQPLTAEEQDRFQDPTASCHICKKTLSSKLSERVRDHCHLTGQYRGPAHSKCNLEYRDSRAIPVVFHNMNYDAHFIIRDLATKIPGRTTVIPQTMEKYISITKYIEGMDVHFRFIDSFRFMASSLEKLASYLPSTPITRNHFKDLEENHFHLLSRKGVFPYEYVSSWETLNEAALPGRVQFYSHLTGSTVSEEDYAHAQKVWSTFSIKTLGQYSDLYLKLDVLLLADVFQNFRENCLSAYGLDPAHYYTAPGLSWDAMLKITGQTLELLTDVDMLLFIERGIRGGISQCSNRYAAANNPYMETFDSSKPTEYLMYYDVNNLYGWALGEMLPYGDFKWVDTTTFWDVPESSDIGYILEVDLAYPEDLHEKHRDLPFCPELKAPPGTKEKRLLTTLYNKERYIIHYRNLKQALDNGLTLTRIHRILQFKQSAWLKPYINLNTELRKHAKNEFEKSLFKLMNNSVFGKTMESVRHRIDVKLVTKWEGRYGAEALIARPNFHTRAVFGENLVAIQLKKLEVLMNKPIYVGFCVLDLSKTVMYDFHYNTMPKLFASSPVKLLYMDTDSLIYDIKCPNVYEVMKQNLSYFDTSDYPKDNRFGIPLVNKKVIGLMKDECCGEIMTEFVGLRSKMYSVRVDHKDKMKKCKGIKASVVKNTISFDDFTHCLNENIIQTRTQYMFKSKLHNVTTIQQTKIALSPADKKRFLLEDSTDTLPWGHKNIHINCLNDG